ncbi:MAG: NAD(P)-dependent oxidoreductase, partial [Firmicutes bacterium]|nr:NAD(P)-dependent oxidoreductase [Bacillota bacterium]
YLLNNPTGAYRVNIGGTINVLEASRLMEVGKVVYISTNGIFTSKKYDPIDEDHPVITANEGPGNGPYSISKLASEAFGLFYGTNFSFTFISLRPSAVYGFGMQYPMYIKPMVENSVKKLPTHFDSGRGFPRDYTYVEDVVQAVYRAMDVNTDDLADRIFLVATGCPLITPGQIAEIIKGLIPDSNIEIGEGLTEWNKREIKYRGQINIGRAQKQLGYQPKYDIIKGIEDYILMYSQYLKSKG